MYMAVGLNEVIWRKRLHPFGISFYEKHAAIVEKMPYIRTKTKP